MVDIAKVNLYGQQIGSVRWDSYRNIALFEYSDKFIGKSLEPSPILMPVRQGQFSCKALYGSVGIRACNGCAIRE